MKDSAPYTVTEILYEGSRAILCRAVRNADRCPVVLKVLSSRISCSNELERLKREYAIGKTLDTATVVKPLALETYQGMPALVMEDFDGQSLDRLLGAPMEVERLLALAVRIAAALADIHQQGVVHNDLKPQNILVKPTTFEVKIANFGFASQLPCEPQAARSPGLIEGSLPYLSPEQTGRMNRTLDHRTDLYSFGVTLYEMLTGVLPFQATDPLEVVHSHIAKRPTPPHELLQGLPEAVSSIVMKLLSKAAEDRYQSAYGLKVDLLECLVQLSATGQITPFPLGRHDRGFGLLLPQKLYGREVDVATLLSAWNRARQGAAELVLISGDAGVGKSALVHEIYKAIAGRPARFIAGKFDQVHRSVPYASMVQAFRELIRQLLTERAEALTLWRRKLLVAVGQSGQVLIDLIPELELIIGPQPSVPGLNPAESQNRFNLVFQAFLRAFTTAERPLVLFLDDLQWADLASLKLLTLLLSDPERAYLLVIGAYRDNEIEAGHPLPAAEAEIRKAGTKIVEITLLPLRLPDTTQLIADALGCDKPRAAPLAKLVLDKTQGNPFFVKQFLLSLHKDQWLTFDVPTNAFCWDLDRIQRASSTDNVVDFMAKKLRRLTPSTQRILTLAACIGHEFDLKTLATINEKPPAATAADLGEALEANIVLPLDNEYRFLHSAEHQSGEGALPLEDINISYRFLHDRVQQAAYSLIEDSKRRAVHLRIGKLLYASTQGSAREDVLLALVNHLNFGAPLLTDPDERLDLARLNLVAGKRVKAATAYQAAASYLAEGMNLLSAKSWEHDYELCFELHAQRAECEYLNGRFEEAESLFEIILSRVRSDLERAHIYELRMILYSTLGKMADTVRVGLTGLALFGVTFPEDERAREAALAAALAEISENLGQRRIEDLVHAPVITDPVQRMIMKLLATVSAPASFINPTFFSLIIATEVNLALKHGHSEVSAYVYASYGMILTGIMARYREAYAFGTLAMDLNEKFNNVDQTCKLSNVFGSFISYFSRPLRESLDLFERGNQAGLETGDFTFVSYNCLQFPMMRLGLGDELSAVRTQCDKLLTLMQRTKDAYSTACLTAARQMIENLTGRTHGRGTLSDQQFDEGAFVAEIERVGLTTVVCWYYTIKAVLAVLYEDYTGALQMAAKAEERAGNAVGFFFVTDLCFYTCLALTAQSPGASADQRERGAAMLVERQAKLALWAEHCPENFLHKYLLISAEQARVTGDETKAMNLYDQAIRAAHESEFLHHEALASELTAKFHLASGRTKIARVYMADAVYGYTRWGAEAKVAQLREKYTELWPRDAEGALKTAWPTETMRITGATQLVDFATVMKASQAISGEIDLAKLLEKLMRVVLENAGANKGLLMLENNGDWSVEAASRGHANEISVLQSVPIDRASDMSLAIVRYVQKTKERVILDDAATEAGNFSSDEYIARRRPRSVLCLPIVRQTKVIGLLYLENDLLPGAFTPDRLASLELLATQAAISLENALLLAKERAARTAAEEAERRAAFLAEAGALLSESLDYEETLARIGRMCVGFLADFCMIDVLMDGGEIRRLAGAHVDPSKEPLLKELQQRYPPRWSSPHVGVRVLRTGKPLVFPEVSDESLRSASEDDEHLRLLRKLGLRTVLAVPLVARGQTLAALSLGSSAPERCYGRADLELALEVASRAALAIDNARLYRASQEAVRLRDEFLTVASHELNTPMTSLKLSLQALHRAVLSGRSSDPQAMAKRLKLTLRQGERLARLISALLDVSRIDAGRLPLELADVDLGALVRDVVERFEPDLAQSQCSVSILNNAPAAGRWDASLIDQVVTNVLLNAITFGRGKPIEIFIGEDANIARLTVKDHGIGIEPTLQTCIFERFERAVSVQHYGGLGLGLYISRRIVEAHGGSIRVESQPSAGSTFTVELPCAGPRFGQGHLYFDPRDP